MNEYQKERINNLMKNEWESYCRHADALADPLLSDAVQANRHFSAMSAALERLNGMRETLLVLGYSVRCVDNSYPQIA